LNDRDKVNFIKELIKLLNEKSIIYIGDIAFERRSNLEKCKNNVENIGIMKKYILFMMK